MTSTFFFLPDAVVPEPGKQPQMPVAGMIPKQETATVPLNLYVRIHKGLMEWVVPLSHLAKLGLTVNAAVLFRGHGSLPVLFLCSPTI